MKRILITGSRTWNDPRLVEDAIAHYMTITGLTDEYVVVHGDAVGADTMAGYAAGILKNVGGWNVSVEIHPADWSLGKSAGVQRNQAMVDMGADVCLAFVRNNSPGATHCLNAARAAGIPVTVFRD